MPNCAPQFVSWAIRTAARIAPWCDLWIVPHLESQVGNAAGDIATSNGGGCWVIGTARPEQAVAAVALREVGEATDATLHELFHVVEPHLPAALSGVIYAAAASSSIDYGCAYFDALSERAARMFAAWSLVLEYGAPPRRSTCPLEAAFHQIYSGRVRPQRQGTVAGWCS